MFEATVQAQLDKLNKNPSDCGAMKELLHQIRLKELRYPELTLQYGAILIKSFSNSLGDELWDICDQVFFASLDCNQFEWSMKTMDMMEKRFPDSLRIKRMMGYLREATGHFDKAEEVYDQLIEADSSDTTSLKRKIVLCRLRNQPSRAIAALNKHLEVYQTDLEAWKELADIYLEEGNYQKALFCLEELIASFPQDYAVSLKYAETLYSAGGLQNLENARKYYSHCLVLNEDSTRAAWGLNQTCNAIKATDNKANTEDNEKLLQMSEALIRKGYKTSPIDINNYPLFN